MTFSSAPDIIFRLNKVHYYLISLSLLFLSNGFCQNNFHVYINEVRPQDAGTDNREFVELIGPAGTQITNFRIDHHDGASASDGVVWSTTIGNFNIPDDGIVDNGGTALGLYVLGDNQVSNVDESTGWTNDRLIDDTAGLILYDDSGNILDAVAWGSAGDITADDPGTVTTTSPTSANNFLHVTQSDDAGNNSLQAPNDVLGDNGSGWALANETAGIINSNQTSGDVTLPITLSFFEVLIKNNNVELKWKTESEVNNLGFEILRSETPGDNYKLITSYQTNPALLGEGNSNVSTEYFYIDPIDEEQFTYWYKLVDVDFNGEKTEHGPIRVSTAMASEDRLISNPFILYPAYPNPFNPKTTIRFEILSSSQDYSDVVLSIFNPQGQLVKRLYRGQLGVGTHELQWNGESDNGIIVASGMYYGLLKVGNSAKTTKLLLVK